MTIWHGQEDTSAKSIEKLVARFNQTHPDIKVSTESGGATADGMLPKITAALTSDAYPDIAYLYGSRAPNVARNPPGGPNPGGPGSWSPPIGAAVRGLGLRGPALRVGAGAGWVRPGRRWRGGGRGRLLRGGRPTCGP
ncbi:extracellular solute-binding protein [Nonomuraea sp. NPDC052265]|uniref:extracellular solute-binding protein n=1 Tax=Nonomuraea sp. NPDC052265 TaxID=3364374 RepID=UPI0037C7F404